MAEQVIVRIAGAYMRREDQSEFKYYKFCSLSDDAMIKSGASYTENPIKGHVNGYNFGYDFRGQYPHDSIQPNHRYYLKNGNYLEIRINQILDPIPETMGSKRAYVALNFIYPKFEESPKSGYGTIYTLVDDLHNYNFQVGSFINSYNSWYGEGTGAIQSLYKYTTNQGTISPSLYIPSIEGRWVTSGNQHFPERTLEDGTVIPAHIGFDVFDWAGESAITGTDPYDPGDDSDGGGGEGDFDDSSDPIDFPDLPDISVVDTGFVNLFNPTIGQLQSLADYMWSDLFSIDSFKKIFADPMDCILGLSVVPVTVPDGGLSPVTVGNISTGVNLNKAGAQYVEIDCGTLNVNEYWGAYLDYSPYTNVQIYLPYIGFQHLNIDDVMKKAVHIKYHIDILSGSLCAYVKCGDSVLYTYTGQCSLTIPVNANNFTQMITSIASGLIKTGVGFATGGIGGAVGAGVQSAISVASSKPTVERSGQLTGMGGILGIQKPYMILSRPRQCLPKGQNGFTGYPSYVTVTLSSLSGYTEVAEIHLENVPATSEELAEIEQLLRNGVII